MEAAIHPLVLLGLSDHATRARLSDDSSSRQALVGCILGQQIGLKATMTSTFEVSIVDGAINSELLKDRVAQLKEIYPELTIIGCYAICEDLHQAEIQILHTISELVGQKLLFLVYNPNSIDDEHLIKLFEPKDGLIFALQFQVDSSETERIVISELNQAEAANETTPMSKFQTQIQHMNKMLDLLTERVLAVHIYLKGVCFGLKNSSIDGNLQRSQSLMVKDVEKREKLMIKDSENSQQQDFIIEQEQPIQPKRTINHQLLRMLDKVVMKIPLLQDNELFKQQLSSSTSSSKTVNNTAFSQLIAKQYGLQSYLFEANDANVSVEMVRIITMLQTMDLIRKKFASFDREISRIREIAPDEAARGVKTLGSDFGNDSKHDQQWMQRRRDPRKRF
ncbi:MAG: hypothetical protein EZS28_009729 [Streblomastix strix]|uniref:MPN domain-containing protein n=1 Tax=Streblomastix strix TaxID=222440 RepID=A0A5J4WJ52_9EUKA|nr:MAG: hypothetical protein EZS28_009729 [Streblomastix strix]